MPGGHYWSWLLLWLRELHCQKKDSPNIQEEVVHGKVWKINELLITGDIQRPDHNRIRLHLQVSASARRGRYIFRGEIYRLCSLHGKCECE